MFSGSLVAIVTPMRADGAIDPEAWVRLLEFHLRHGTSGIVVGGTTGESATLSDAELKTLVTSAVKQARGRAQVIAGAGTSSTATSVERAGWLSGLGVDALLVVTPAYNRPTQEGLYRHFAAVAEASTVPLLLYNVPSRTAVDLLPETVARLAGIPRIVGLKEAVPAMDRIHALRERCPPGFAILSGDDATAREAILAGAGGVISVTANVAPAAMAAMVAAALGGNVAAAAALDSRLAPLHHALFLEPNPIPVKWALAQMGLIGGGIRLPLTALDAAQQPALRAAMQASGVPAE
jgi:4-hydroxy-tetrahydrodipicolinate synthase